VPTTGFYMLVLLALTLVAGVSLHLRRRAQLAA
jgi:hypothetical protein